MSLKNLVKNIVDVRVADGTNGKNIMISAMKGVLKEGASEVLLHLINKPESYRKMYGALKYMIKMNRTKYLKLRRGLSNYSLYPLWGCDA